MRATERAGVSVLAGIIVLAVCVRVALAGDGAVSDAIRAGIRAAFRAPVEVSGTPTDGDVLTYNSATGKWAAEAGGAAQTPWTGNVDAAGYDLTGVNDVVTDATGQLNLGGTTSTYPALRYGSSTGVVELLRADGSADSVTLRGAGSGTNVGASFLVGAASASGGGTLNVVGGDANDTNDSGGSLTLAGGSGVGTGAGGTITIAPGPTDSGTPGYVVVKEADSSTVAHVGSQGLSIVGTDALNMKDVTSAPTVTAGYVGVASVNTAGTQTLVAIDDGGSHTLATRGYYSAGAHFRVLKTADQTFTGGGAEIATWSSEAVDQANAVDLGTYNTRIFTAPVAGVLTVNVSVRWAADADTNRTIALKNTNSAGTDLTRVLDSFYVNDAGNGYWQTISWTVHMAAGDYVRLQGQPIGGTVNMDDVGGDYSAGTCAAVAEGFFVPD